MVITGRSEEEVACWCCCCIQGVMSAVMAWSTASAARGVCWSKVLGPVCASVLCWMSLTACTDCLGVCQTTLWIFLLIAWLSFCVGKASSFWLLARAEVLWLQSGQPGSVFVLANVCVQRVVSTQLSPWLGMECQAAPNFGKWGFGCEGCWAGLWVSGLYFSYS